jgi:Tfp pilus assembly PilM family ATPase/Tfp pilus assembly protein PilN
MISKKLGLRKNKFIKNILELDEPYIRYTQFTENKNGKNIIEHRVERIYSSPLEETTIILKNIISQIKDKPSSIVMAISRKSIFIKYYHFPSINDKELKEMIYFQLIRELPIPQEEIIYDYTIIHKNETHSLVVVFIVQKPFLDRYRGILHKIGIEPAHITIVPYTLFNWVINTWKDLIGKNEIVGLLHIDYSGIELIIFNQQQLIFTRSMRIEDFHNIKEENPDCLIEALNKHRKAIINFVKDSLNAYKKNVDYKEIRKILMGDYGKETNQLKKMLEKELSLSIELIDCFVWPDNIKNLKETIGFSQEVFSRPKTLGLILLDNTFQIDFLKQEKEKKHKSFIVKRDMITLFSLITLIVLLISGIIGQWFWKERKYIKKLKNEISLTQTLAEQLKATKRKTAIIRQHLNRTNSSIEILAEIYRIIPARISLSGFIYNSDGNVTLQGTSSQMSRVFKLVTILEKSDLFEKVKLKYASKRQIRHQEITDFEVFCQFLPGKMERH